MMMFRFQKYALMQNKISELARRASFENESNATKIINILNVSCFILLGICQGSIYFYFYIIFYPNPKISNVTFATVSKQ